MNYQFTKPNKNHPRPFLRHSNVSIMDAGSEKYPTMVTIHKAPAWGKALVGKNYISIEHAVKAISIFQAENIIRKLARTAKDDLMDLGLAPKEEYAFS
jgi:hypothetical protein